MFAFKELDEDEEDDDPAAFGRTLDGTLGVTAAFGWEAFGPRERDLAGGFLFDDLVRKSCLGRERLGEESKCRV